MENYNLLSKDDYLKSELSSVESFKSTNISAIPIVPNVSYVNKFNLNSFDLINEFDFMILKRNESTSENPSESLKLNINSELINNFKFDKINLYNKFKFFNSYNDYYFNKDSNLNHNSKKSSLFMSSEFFYNLNIHSKSRLKFILPVQFANTNKRINEDSNSISFNYQNQYSENRFYGNDLFDSSPRFIYGLENIYKINNQEFQFNINQSYEMNKNSNYLNKINQNSNLSDLAFEAKTSVNDISFIIDTRLNKENFSKKEMNYSMNYGKNFDFFLNYNETDEEAFKNLSNDTKSLNYSLSKRINKNINVQFSSNLDLKNNYDPYQSSVKIILSDECSELELTYSNSRYNDNFNTQPTETIGITFRLDYLGFLGYEQSTDLFFSEPGNINYGL